MIDQAHKASSESGGRHIWSSRSFGTWARRSHAIDLPPTPFDFLMCHLAWSSFSGVGPAVDAIGADRPVQSRSCSLLIDNESANELAGEVTAEVSPTALA